MFGEFQISKKLSTRMFQHFQTHNSQAKIIFPQKVPGIFLILLGVLVSPKINNIGFWAWRRDKNAEIMEVRVLGFEKNDSGILLYQSGAD